MTDQVYEPAVDLEAASAIFDVLRHDTSLEVTCVIPRYSETTKQWTSQLGGVWHVKNVADLHSVIRTHNPRGNLYVGLNQRRPGMQHGAAASNDDIDAITAILIDLDAERPNMKEPATDDELEYALAATKDLNRRLKSDGLIDCTPATLMSGNGYQMWIGIPPVTVTDDDRVLWQRRLEQFHRAVQELCPPGVKIDATFDLRRIAKIPGTVSRKGHHTAERPHRTARWQTKAERRESKATLNWLLACGVTPFPRAGDADLTLPEGSEPLPPDLEALVEIWCADEPGDRSEAFQLIANHLVSEQVKIPVVRTALRLVDRAWGSKYGDRKDPEREATRSISQALAAGAECWPRTVTWLQHGLTPPPIEVDSAKPLVRAVDAPERTRAELQPFPVDVFPPAIQRFIEEATASLFVPTDMIGVGVLAVLAAAIGNSRAFILKDDYFESPVLWVGIVGDPGAKKTPALRLATLPLHDQQSRLTAKYKHAKQEYEHDLEEWENTPREDKPKRGPRPVPPAFQRLVVDDITMEALAPVVQSNPKVALIRDELTGWVRSLNQYKGGRGADRSNWLSMWSSSHIMVDRKSSPEPIHIPRPVVSVLGGIQPELLNELRDEQSRDDGFTDRILFSYPEEVEDHWTKTSVSREAREAYRAVVNNLLNLTGEVSEAGDHLPLYCGMTDEAEARWSLLYEDHQAEYRDPDLLPRLRGPYSKIRSYAARFALILQLARIAAGERVGEHVDEQSITDGWVLADYFKSHMRKVYHAIESDKDDRRVERALEWITNHGGSITLRDLARGKVVKGTQEGKDLMKLLVDRGHGDVEREKVRGGERWTFTLAGYESVKQASADNDE